jgi:ABC-2 type transport system permease protein
LTAFAPAVSALVGRDLRAFLRSRSQLYSSLLFPLMLLAVLGTGIERGLNPTLIRDGDYVSFLVPGIVVMTAVFSSTFSSASFYQDRDDGMLRVLLATPNPPWVVMLGKSLAGVIIGSLQALAVIAVASLIPEVHLAWQYGVAVGLLASVAGIVLLNLMLAGVAQGLASRIRTMSGFHLVMNLALFPALFFSGAFYPLAHLPAWLEVLGWLNPLSFGVDLLHVAMYADTASGYFGLAVDFAVLTTLSVAVYAWGLSRHAREGER